MEQIENIEQSAPRYGDFAYLKVKQINAVGAFLDTGTDKDLLLPFAEQTTKVVQGKSYVVAVIIDEQTERPMATQKIKRFFNTDTSALKEGMPVALLVSHFSNLGTNVIVNNEYAGLIYANEIFVPLNIGQKLDGFIKKIRAHGKLDISLKKQGYVAVAEEAEVILSYLKKHGNTIAMGDFTPPEVIHQCFGMSKKSFKKAIGKLFKENRILITPTGISLTE